MLTLKHIPGDSFVVKTTASQFSKTKKYLLHQKYKFPEIQWQENNLWNKSSVALLLIS